MRLNQPLAPLVLLALLLPVSGDPPAWWRDGDQPVIDPAAPTNNYGPANIGQAKWMARQALTALQAVDAASAAAVTAELVGPGKPLAGWDAPVTQAQRAAQRAPLLCGQLKAIGAPFYQQLHARNPAWLSAERVLNQTHDLTDNTNIHPWPSTTSAAANHAIATIGQLKAVFSLRFETFNLTLDDDHDGLTNAEERILGTDPNNPETLTGYPDAWLAINYYDDLINGDIMTIVPDYDSDGDGLTNAQEAELGSDPNVPDNPGIMQETLRNGDFSDPQIGSGLRYKSSALIWDYWGGGVDAWTAVVGSNVEFQSIEPNCATTQQTRKALSVGRSHLVSNTSSEDNPCAELKAHPAGNYGIKQRVGTHIDANYMLVFECKARQKIAPYDNNFTVNIDGAVVKDITFDTIEPWATKAAAFKATSNITEISLVPYNNIDDTKGGLVDNVRLVPVEVAVDADRNGTIDFVRDRTTADKPFRFWINNDQDDVETDEPILVEMPDCFDRETIKTKRDLEDFCRLKVQVGLPNQKLRDNRDWSG